MVAKPLAASLLTATDLIATQIRAGNGQGKPLDVVLNFGGVATTETYPVSSSGVFTDIFDTDLEPVSGLTVTVSAIEGVNSVGRGNSGDTSRTLTNNELLTTSLVASTAVPSFTTSFSGAAINPNSTFTVSITATRTTTDTDRWGVYTVGGQVLEINAAANPPDIITFIGVTGQQLLDNGILCEIRVGSIFAYISGVKITEDPS